MGRLAKEKVDEIIRLRQRGYTQKEAAEKAKVHLRTVRKYDPLRDRRPVKPTPEQIKEINEDLTKLVAEGLAQEESEGRFLVTPLGKQAWERYEELKKNAVLQFMAEKGRPVREAEVERYLDGVSEELFREALNEVKG